MRLTHVTFAPLFNRRRRIIHFHRERVNPMKIKLIAASIVAGAFMLPIASHAYDTDSNRSSVKTYAKDSVITTKIKAELAEEKVSSLAHISVDTTDAGVVVLSGTAHSNHDAEKAVKIARAVKGVTSVENNIRIKADK
jgi:hyperosmotically inducible protein